MSMLIAPQLFGLDMLSTLMLGLWLAVGCILLSSMRQPTTASSQSALTTLGDRVRRVFQRPPPACDYLPLVAAYTTDLIAVLDLDGAYRYVSPSHQAQLGYPEGSLLGRKCRELIHPDDLAVVLTAWSSVLSEQSKHVVCRVATIRGEWRWLQVQIRPQNLHGERVLVLAARDITAERVQTAQLHDLQRTMMVGTIAGMVIHDLNNMLTVVTGAAALAAEDIEHGTPQHDDLLLIQQASRHAGDLTRHLLQFLRGRSIERSRIDPYALLREMQPLIRRVVGCTIDIKFDLEVGLWPVRADQVQIEQILLNLVLNARDAMAGAGRMLVRARNVRMAGGAEMIRIEVADSGAGIAHDLREQMFTPFVSTKAPSKGTGLGLASCRWIVEQLGGTIEVSSVLGHGSTFAIVLPRATD